MKDMATPSLKKSARQSRTLRGMAKEIRRDMSDDRKEFP